MDRLLRTLVIAAAWLLLLAPDVAAQTVDAASLAVTATVQSSIAIAVESPAATYSRGPNGVTVPFRVASDGSASRGFAARRDATGWIFAAPVGIRVEQANLGASGYTVVAQLSRTPQRGTEWSVNSKALSASAPVPLTADAPYGTRQEFICQVRTFGKAVPSIENSFELTVILN